MPKDLSVAQLERLLEKKRVKLEGLIKRRARLQKELAKVEGGIVSIGGIVREGRKPRRGRKRPKNTKTLFKAATEALTNNRKGLTLKELAAKIVEGGYKTGSSNFENTVYQIIYKNRATIAHDPKTKTYRLK
jgi:RNA polymerase-interacting CarD/CdnL/TRCF family regulator